MRRGLDSFRANHCLQAWLVFPKAPRERRNGLQRARLSPLQSWAKSRPTIELVFAAAQRNPLICQFKPRLFRTPCFTDTSRLDCTTAATFWTADPAGFRSTTNHASIRVLTKTVRRTVSKSKSLPLHQSYGSLRGSNRRLRLMNGINPLRSTAVPTQDCSELEAPSVFCRTTPRFSFCF